LAALSVTTAACGDRRLTTIRAPGGAGTGGGTGGAGTGGPPSTCDTKPIGYAAFDPSNPTSTTPAISGGQGGDVVTVTTPQELGAAAGSPDALVIMVKGMLEFPTGQVPVSSDKTILGVGSASGLMGGGLNIFEADNVIVRNLVIKPPQGRIDAIQIYKSQHVWIDHCDLSTERLTSSTETYDGLIDIVSDSNLVTVSWTRFHDHNHTSLIGNSDSTTEEKDLLKVTYHHNLFQNIQTYGPSIRFGELHAFNNYYVDVFDNAIWARMGARALVEANFFQNVPQALKTEYDKGEGFITEKNNFYMNSPAKTYTAGTDWTPPYRYTPELADDVLPASVLECVGTSANIAF